MAKAESKTILKAYSTVESKLPTLPLEDGQLIFVYDKKKIILDNHGVRTVYEQIQTIETEEQRNDLLAPIDSFYFVIETSILWRYSNGHWNQITTSPQEQIDRIVAEGTKQVKAVRDEGQKVLQSIPEDFQMQMESKLDKQQGIENKGKALVIGEDGNVVPGEVASGGGDGIAIINTMSGESPLVIPDSAERVNKGLELGGKTEQVQTTGKNLFDSNIAKNKENYKEVTIAGSVIYAIELSLKPNTKYAFQCVIKSVTTTMNVGNSTIRYVVSDGQKRVIMTNEDGKLYIGFSGNVDSEIGKIGVSIVDIQVEEGDTQTAYEPYTGGKPSPSQEYQQKIKNVGKWNEAKQKYEVDVKITNAEQNWNKEQSLTLTSDRPITKWDRLVEQGGEYGWLYGSVIATIDETTGISLYTSGELKGFYANVKNIDPKEKIGYCDKLYSRKMLNGEPCILFGMANNSFLYTLNTRDFYGETVSEIREKLKEYPLNIVGKSASTEFVPLPQEEQNAIRALKTYYPTTVITVDGGELDPDIKVTYTADTKNYIDNKFGKTINAMQTKLLELESRV